ncbi:hypothetical protein DFH06DRAFT_1148853, partial [Mycena polygramma]
MLARHQNETERSADAPTSPLQDLDRRGEVVTTTCSTFDLLGLYTALEEPDDILRADSAEDDLKTLDSTLFWEQFTRENPRRSSRLVAKLPSNQPLPDKRKRRPDSNLTIIQLKIDVSVLAPRLSHRGQFSCLGLEVRAIYFRSPCGCACFSQFGYSNVKSGKRKYRSKGSAPHKRAGTKQKHKPDGTDNPAHLAQMMKRTFDRADAMLSNVVQDSPRCISIIHRVAGNFAAGRAKALTSVAMNSIDQVQEMIDTLVGRHLASQKLREACSTGERGYHRQSAKKPFLTSWHQKNKADVDAFLALPITQRIIQGISKWVSSVVKLVFPGVAASFEKEAAIILE